MHIASCSKLMTAIAMTKLLNVKNIPYGTPIIKYLPGYDEGAKYQPDQLANLMTHTSGFNSGTSSSDYEFMKNQVAAGVTAHGQYHYQNMNFELLPHSDFRDRQQHLGQPELARSFQRQFLGLYNDQDQYRTFMDTNVFAPSVLWDRPSRIRTPMPWRRISRSAATAGTPGICPR